MTFQKLKKQVEGVPEYVKTHWKTPNEGEYLSLQEVVAYTATSAGSFIFGTASGIMTFSASYFCGAIMGIAAMDFYIIGLVGTILGYILMFTNPIGVLIYENHGRLTPKMKAFAHTVYIAELTVGIGCYFIPSEQFEFIMKGLPQIVGNSLVIGVIQSYITWWFRRKFCAKYGRLKPFVLMFAFPAAIIMSIIPFLPMQDVSYTAKLIILHFVFSLMNFFYYNYSNVGGLVTFMTPNSQERQRLYSIVPIITGIVPSIIGMFFPILIGVTGGYLNLQTYKVFVPIFAFAGAFTALFVAKCKERIIEEPIETRKKVKFWSGAKHVLSNKYFWITNISNILGQWQYLANGLLAWWFIYSLRMEWFSGIAGNIVVVGMTLGNLLCPVLTRKYQKKNILISFRALTALTVLGMALAVKMENIFIFMFAVFLKNTVSPIVDGINGSFQADILDYHQWKYGERADSMSGVFGWFLSPINMIIGFIMPWLLKTVGFTSDWDVLYDSVIMNNVFSIYTWGSLIAIIAMTIPFFFYNLTREKHDMCVKELEERLASSHNEEETEENEAVTVTSEVEE